MDLFYAMNHYKQIDLATIAPISLLTGGDVLMYSPFDIMIHGEKLHYDIFRILTRN